MTHCFDTQHAVLYGIEEAIFINHFQFWVAKNKANERHQKDGKTWTYNTIKAFSELFPYFTEKQARRVLESLRSKGVLITGHFNNGYDRTLWYAFADEAKFLEGQMDLPKRANGNAQAGKSVITSDVTDSKPSKGRGTKQQIEKFFAELSLPRSDAEWFFFKCEGNGWTNGGKRILDWKATIRSWKAGRYLPSQKNNHSANSQDSMFLSR